MFTQYNSKCSIRVSITDTYSDNYMKKTKARSIRVTTGFGCILEYPPIDQARSMPCHLQSAFVEDHCPVLFIFMITLLSQIMKLDFLWTEIEVY